jgi:hypothetical protein
MSSDHNNLSRFREAVNDGIARAVPMDGLDCVVFSQIPCIGTDRLGGCSVILIISPFAAILAHIPPQPSNPDINDLEAGDRHAKASMERVTTYYRQFQGLFPATSHSWVVCAVFEGAVAVPDQQRIMQAELWNIGLPVDTNHTYRIPFTGKHRDSGAVFVDGSGHTIEVYVEERLVASFPRGHAATTASGSSGEAWWQWNAQLQSYQYGTEAGVQRSQTEPPVGVWVFSSSKWGGTYDWALWDGSAWQYQ